MDPYCEFEYCAYFNDNIKCFNKPFEQFDLCEEHNTNSNIARISSFRRKEDRYALAKIAEVSKQSKPDGETIEQLKIRDKVFTIISNHKRIYYNFSKSKPNSDILDNLLNTLLGLRKSKYVQKNLDVFDPGKYIKQIFPYYKLEPIKHKKGTVTDIIIEI